MHENNNYPSNCNRSLFVHFFQFDFGCTTYVHPEALYNRINQLSESGGVYSLPYTYSLR
jgi:hypothetical protein